MMPKSIHRKGYNLAFYTDYKVRSDTICVGRRVNHSYNPDIDRNLSASFKTIPARAFYLLNTTKFPLKPVQNNCHDKYMPPEQINLSVKLRSCHKKVLYMPLSKCHNLSLNVLLKKRFVFINNSININVVYNSPN